MSKIRLIVFMVAMTAFTGMNAQKFQGQDTKNDTWNSVWLQWNPMKTHSDYAEFNKIKATGFTAGFSKTFKVCQKLPIFASVGIGAQYAYSKDTKLKSSNEYQNLYRTDKYRALSAKVPVQIMYKYNIPNVPLAVIPFFGIHGKFNIFAKNYLEYVGVEDGVVAYNPKSNYNCFDDDDMKERAGEGAGVGSGSGAAWKRFQVGWELGFKVRYDSKYTLGISWGSEFNDFAKGTNLRYTNVTLGLDF